MGETYPDYCEERYAPFIDMVVAGRTEDTTYREEGCGIGTFTKILQRKGIPNVKLFDLSRDMSLLASVNTGMNARRGNILHPHERAGVILSHGVLEHFQDNVINAMLYQQRHRCGRLVHYVSTDGYAEPSFGDERLLPVEYWLDNFKPASHLVFNDGCDLVMNWMGT